MNYLPTPIAPGLYWVGAQNPNLRVFDVVMSTERGTSYNAYLLVDEKITLFETVKDGYEDQMLERIRAIVDPAKIDYIVLEHTEPDHSGAIGKVLEAAPNAHVYGSTAAMGIVKEILGADFPNTRVKTGDTLCVGSRTLEFTEVPFLHWPDSIFTYIPQDGTLVSGDVFGFHRSDMNLFTDATDSIDCDLKYYFDCIFGPFQPHVRQMLQKIAGKRIERILPSHGTIHRTEKDIAHVLDAYRHWSADAPKNDPRSAFVGFSSAYGYTATAARYLAESLSQSGWHVDFFDLGDCDSAAAKAAAESADALFIGSSTLNHDVLPPVWHLLSNLSFHVVKGKPAAVFGSFGWSGEAIKMMEDRLTGLGAKLAVPSLKFRLSPIGPKQEAIRTWVRTLCETL